MKEREGSKREGVRKMRKKYKSQNKNCNYREWGTRRLLTAVGRDSPKRGGGRQRRTRGGGKRGLRLPDIVHAYDAKHEKSSHK